MATPSDGIDMSFILTPIYVGFVLSLIFGGITVVQGYLYFPSKDRFSIQAVAVSMLVMDLLSTVLVLKGIYDYLIPAFGSLVPFSTFAPELSADCLLSTIITFISQLYFVVQLYTVTAGKSPWLQLMVWIIMACAIVAFAGGVGCTTLMFTQRHRILDAKGVGFSLLFGIAKGFGAITDIIATISMCMLLSTARTGLSQSNLIISSLMIYIVERGALVTVFQLLLTLLFFALPQRTIWLGLHMCVTKLYVNTFFAMLNGRAKLVSKRTAVSLGSYGMSSSQERERRRMANLDIEDQKFGSSLSTPMPTVTRSVVVCEV